MIISINTEKALDRIQYLFLIKTVSYMDMGRSVFSLLKRIYKVLTANITLNDEPLKASCLGRAQGRTSTSVTLPSLEPAILASAVRQEKEIIGMQAGKGEVKLFLFADDI